MTGALFFFDPASVTLRAHRQQGKFPKMAAMDNMVRTLLKAMDVDVDAVKEEVTRRIKLFEGNLDTLNGTLITIMETQKRNERNIHLIAAALCPDVILEPIPTANGATQDGQRNALSAPV